MNKIPSQIIWFNIGYFCFILLIFSKTLDFIPFILLIAISISLPLFVWIKTQSIIQKHFSQTNRKFATLLLSIPGFLFGIQLSYGLFQMGHGENIVSAILPITLISILFGLISGFVGKTTLETK